VYRPVPGRWLSQGRSQHQRSKSTPGVKVNTRRRLGEETLSASVTKKRRRQGKASPRWRRRPTRASPDQTILKQGNHSVVPRYPQVGKTMEGDNTAKRQRIVGRVFPDTYRKEKPWRERPPPEHSAFRHPGTIRRCCSRPLLRRRRLALRIKERTVSVLETPRGRYGFTRWASPWAWALARDLSQAYKAAQRSERSKYNASKTTKAQEGQGWE